MRFFVSGPRILGVRPGVIFSAADIARLGSSGRAARGPSFVYVIEGPSHVKIGVTRDPIGRLAALQTGSSGLLRLAYVAAVKSDNALAIEAEAHRMLDRWRQVGEWFAVPASAAVATINAASYQTGDAIVSVPVDQIAEIARGASAPAPGGLLVMLVQAAAIAVVAFMAAVATIAAVIAFRS